MHWMMMMMLSQDRGRP